MNGPNDYGVCEGCTEPTEALKLYRVTAKAAAVLEAPTFEAWYCAECAANAVGDGNGQGGFAAIEELPRYEAAFVRLERRPR